jgi:hypothetical protein
MKKLILLLMLGLLSASSLVQAAETADQVIVYAAYPNNSLSYIYVISADGDGKAPDTRTNVAYLKPPVFTDQTFVSRYYRNILCTKYSICN